MGVTLCFSGHGPPGHHELEENETWSAPAPATLRFTLVAGRVLVEGRGSAPEVLGLDEVVRSGPYELFIGDGLAPAPFEARSTREAELFAALHASPGDHDLRQVYGDWLEESGYPNEAEVLGIERQRWRADGRLDVVEDRRLAYRLRRVSKRLPLVWRQVATRPAILGCAAPDCPRSWDRLAPKDAGVRACGVCQADVRFAATEAGAAWQRHIGRHVALDVAQRRSLRPIAGPPASAAPLLGSPFFARPDPAMSIGAAIERLDLRSPPPNAKMPVAIVPGAGHLLRSAFLRHRRDLGAADDAEFSWAVNNDCRELRLAFDGGGADIEAWLAAHFGEPRLAGGWRIYGQWLLRPRGEACSLWWYERLPNWALAEDPAIALEFLRLLVAFLRTSPDFERIKEVASRPPTGSGITVTGELDDRFYLDLAPTIDAPDLAAVLEIGAPASWDDPYEVHWPIHGRGKRAVFGQWRVEAWLAEKPKDVAALTRRDQVIGLCIERA
ncbi:MAG: TIGR02996 domain-containing protein [Labilithrix sp.]